VKLNLIGILCFLLMPGMAFHQKDGLTAYEECRTVTATDLFDRKAPAFADYPTTTREVISNPKLDLTSNAIARTYRTRLRQEVADGPNYAGHYTVAFWGCGTSCTMFAVVNLKTGKVITASEFTTVTGEHLNADDFLPQTESDGWALRHRRDSALLVVVGAPDEDESRTGAFYYVVQGERLRLIHTTHVSKDCENAKP
jgi:hypothetical protein